MRNYLKVWFIGVIQDSAPVPSVLKYYRIGGQVPFLKFEYSKNKLTTGLIRNNM